MPDTMWVRLSRDVDCGLRRGGWYKAVAVEQTEVVLLLAGKNRSLPKYLFEISTAGPTRWTIVSQAGNAPHIPTRWTKGYGVCPSCLWRQLPLGQPKTMLCEGCFQEYEVDWDEPYFKAG
jgi:hypothetical protein